MTSGFGASLLRSVTRSPQRVSVVSSDFLRPTDAEFSIRRAQGFFTMSLLPIMKIFFSFVYSTVPYEFYKNNILE
jgi:hypothetical protein